MMKKKKKDSDAPFSVRLTPRVRRRALRIAEKNGLSITDAINFMAAAGASIVEKKLTEMEAA